VKQRWVLTIEEFGKIDKAQIEVSPFMVFVGENNSGKSYIMYLLWGILALGRELFDYKKGTSQPYKKCEEWLIANIGKDDIVIDEPIQQMFIVWFNELLKQKKKVLCNRIFNHPVDIGHVSVSSYKRLAPIKVNWDKDAKRFSTSANTIKFPLTEQEFSAEERGKMLNYICWKLLMDGLTTPLFPGVNSGRAAGEPIYLPASRTGFMLTYKTLIQNMISREYSGLDDGEQYKSQFVLPLAHFLKDWVGLEISENTKYGDVAAYIEKEILQGEVKRDASPMPSVLYRPEHGKKDLPLHVTSSLVTELTPIILFLKSKTAYNLMIIEEPEAHLHLNVQRVITRALARLVNAGLPIWITTHSDTIFQQINNLVKVGHLKNDEELGELGYVREEVLQPSDITAYQFVVTDKKTTVEKLNIEQGGFPVPTFNEAIYELSTETLRIEEKLTDHD